MSPCILFTLKRRIPYFYFFMILKKIFLLLYDINNMELITLLYEKINLIAPKDRDFRKIPLRAFGPVKYH